MMDSRRTKINHSSLLANARWRNDLLLVLVASVVFTAVVLSYSGQYGRLLFEVDYEDVISHIDGLQRYRDFSEGGILGYLEGYQHAPPHAPLHSLLATVSFALFGVNDWAPYVGNFLIIIAYFGAVIYFLPRSSSLVSKGFALAFAASFPLAFLTVHDFRPDYPAAVFSVWGILLLLDWDPLQDSRMRCWLAGFAFAAALLWKPTVFPYTMAVGGVALAVAVVQSQVPQFSFQQTLKAIFKTWPFFAANAIMALPHFIVAGPKLIEYMIRNQIGADKASWSLKGNFWENSTYHFLGYSGDFQLGVQKWFLLGVIVVALIALVIHPRARSILGVWHFGAGLVVAAIAFFGVAINHHDNPYFGLVFQILLILLCAFVLVQCWSVASNSRTILGRVTTVCLGAAFFYPAVAGSSWPKFRHAAHLDQYEITNYAKSINREIFELIKQHLALADQGNVLVTTYGLISNHSLQWMADKEAVSMTVFGMPNKPMEDLKWIVNQRDQHHQVIDFVIATEPGAYGVHDFLPSADTAGEILETVRENPEFSIIGTFPVPNGTSVHVFQRTSNFGGWDSARGLGPRLPAVENKNLPVKQFGMWPGVTLTKTAADSNTAVLELRWIPVLADTVLSVVVNGELAFQSASADKRAWETAAIEIPIKPGQNTINLLFDGDGPAVVGKPAVTFTRLKLLVPAEVIH